MPGSASDVLPRIAADGRMPMQVYAAGLRPAARGATGRPAAGGRRPQPGGQRGGHPRASRRRHAGDFALCPQTRRSCWCRAARRARVSAVDPDGAAGISAERPRQAGADDQPVAGAEPRSGWTGCCRASPAMSARSARWAACAASGSPRCPTRSIRCWRSWHERGLLYVDPRPGAAPLPLVWSRSVDLVIDEPAAAAEIDAKLAQLARLARDRRAARSALPARCGR